MAHVVWTFGNRFTVTAALADMNVSWTATGLRSVRIFSIFTTVQQYTAFDRHAYAMHPSTQRLSRSINFMNIT